MHVVPFLVEDDETLARKHMSAGMTAWLHSGNHPRLNAPLSNSRPEPSRTVISRLR